MELWQKDLLEVLRDIAQRIPGSYIDDIDRNKVIKQIDVWLKQVGNVAQPDACPQLYDAEATREKLASYAHKQWSGWMDYLFSKCVNPIEADTGTVIIPKWAVERWKRQIETPYEELSEPEKESDRKEADGMLEIICRSFI